DAAWEAQAQNLIAQFRADYARYPDDAAFQDIVDDLRRVSPQFQVWWERQDVRGLPDGPRTMRLPALGTLHFDHVTFQASVTPELRVKVYVAHAETAAKLAHALDRPESS
ncbi:MAG TPA: XRE family transcriptional regulator, partial [Ktedonobacterales bacterium]|nr:XRE family transcriptional regulator [Ktedonobacterales bacterium]